MPSHYGLIEDAPTPDLPGRVVVRHEPGAAIDALAAEIFVRACDCVRAFGDFHLVLSPGSAGRSICSALLLDPLCRELPWNRAHVWVSHAGGHAPDDGYEHFAEALVGHSGILEGNIHDPSGGAPAYQDELQQALAWREPGQDRPDVIVAEPAFPPAWEGDGLFEGERSVRIGARLCNAARTLAVVCEAAAPDGLWTSELRPSGGELVWFMDLTPDESEGAS